jgi:hypothetical protein
MQAFACAEYADMYISGRDDMVILIGVQQYRIDEDEGNSWS